MFGDKAVNNDLDLVDSIGGQHGTLVSIFWATSASPPTCAMPTESGFVGTGSRPGPVYDRVLEQAKTFRGDATIFGSLYFSIYEPILFNGEVIGIL